MSTLKDIAQWNVQDVRLWLEENEFQSEVETFTEHEVDGPALCLLTASDIADLFKRIGPRVKFRTKVEQLTGRKIPEHYCSISNNHSSNSNAFPSSSNCDNTRRTDGVYHLSQGYPADHENAIFAGYSSPGSNESFGQQLNQQNQWMPAVQTRKSNVIEEQPKVQKQDIQEQRLKTQHLEQQSFRHHYLHQQHHQQLNHQKQHERETHQQLYCQLQQEKLSSLSSTTNNALQLENDRTNPPNEYIFNTIDNPTATKKEADEPVAHSILKSPLPVLEHQHQQQLQKIIFTEATANNDGHCRVTGKSTTFPAVGVSRVSDDVDKFESYNEKYVSEEATKTGMVESRGESSTTYVDSPNNQMDKTEIMLGEGEAGRDGAIVGAKVNRFNNSNSPDCYDITENYNETESTFTRDEGLEMDEDDERGKMIQDDFQIRKYNDEKNQNSDNNTGNSDGEDNSNNTTKNKHNNINYNDKKSDNDSDNTLVINNKNVNIEYDGDIVQSNDSFDTFDFLNNKTNTCSSLNQSSLSYYQKGDCGKRSIELVTNRLAVRERSKIFRRSEKKWHVSVNETAYQLALREPKLLQNKKELRMIAEAEVRKTYRFAKGKSRSIAIPENRIIAEERKKQKLTKDKILELKRALNSEGEEVSRQMRQCHMNLTLANQQSDVTKNMQLREQMQKLNHQQAKLHFKMDELLAKERKLNLLKNGDEGQDDISGSHQNPTAEYPYMQESAKEECGPSGSCLQPKVANPSRRSSLAQHLGTKKTFAEETFQLDMKIVNGDTSNSNDNSVTENMVKLESCDENGKGAEEENEGSEDEDDLQYYSSPQSSPYNFSGTNVEGSLMSPDPRAHQSFEDILVGGNNIERKVNS